MSKALTKQLYKGLQEKLAAVTAPKKGSGSTTKAAKKTSGASGGGGKTKRRQQLKASKKAAVAKAGVKASPQSTLTKNVRLLEKLGAHRTQEEVLQQVRHAGAHDPPPCDCLFLGTLSVSRIPVGDFILYSVMFFSHRSHPCAGFEKMSLAAERQQNNSLDEEGHSSLSRAQCKKNNHQSNKTKICVSLSDSSIAVRRFTVLLLTFDIPLCGPFAVPYVLLFP